MKLYQGIVVNNNDPKQIGRLQIRIPVLHGDGVTPMSIQNKGLPWFDPCMPWYGGYQAGSFIIPPVGSVLWCIIDELNASDAHRIYIGGSYGVGAKNSKKFGDKSAPAGELETPKEALEGYPDTSVIFKSLSGSSIVINNDGTIMLKTKETQINMTSTQIDVVADVVTFDANVVIKKQLSAEM